MNFSANDVKELREITGAGMMDCKKALTECDGNKDKAVDYLRAKGLAAAAKKQGRIAADGLVSCFVADNKNASIVEVNCETDFVAKSDDFKGFVSQVSEYIAKNNVKNVEDLLTHQLAGKSVADHLNELTLKIGEKIAVRRFEKMNVTNGKIGYYVHGGKIGVLLKLEAENFAPHAEIDELIKDVCMHVAASDTKFITDSEMDEGFKNKEAEVYAAQLKEQGKPDNMIPNIVKGKLAKLASEVCLYQQKFVKDPDISISDLVKKVSQTTGKQLKFTQFLKMNLGEGIEKKQENFAEEIAKMTSGGH